MAVPTRAPRFESRLDGQEPEKIDLALRALRRERVRLIGGQLAYAANTPNTSISVSGVALQLNNIDLQEESLCKLRADLMKSRAKSD